MKMKRNKSGFTLVEVIVVLVILAILAAIMIPAMTGWIDKAKEKQVYVELREVALAMKSAYAEVYASHSGAGEADIVYISGLTASDQASRDFAAYMQEYLNNDDLWSRVKGVRIIHNMFAFNYQSDDALYNYSDDNGQVTISTV